MNISEQVYEIVRKVPRGKVISYGKIGRMVGIGPRLVGRILHNNPNNSVTPCHRVVRGDGTIASGYAFGGPGEQRKLLEKEGVGFNDNKVAGECFTLV